MAKSKPIWERLVDFCEGKPPQPRVVIMEAVGMVDRKQFNSAVSKAREYGYDIKIDYTHPRQTYSHATYHGDCAEIVNVLTEFGPSPTKLVVQHVRARRGTSENRIRNLLAEMSGDGRIYKTHNTCTHFVFSATKPDPEPEKPAAKPAPKERPNVGKIKVAPFSSDQGAVTTVSVYAPPWVQFDGLMRA